MNKPDDVREFAAGSFFKLNFDTPIFYEIRKIKKTLDVRQRINSTVFACREAQQFVTEPAIGALRLIPSNQC